MATPPAKSPTVGPWLPWWATYLVSFIAGFYFIAIFVEAVKPDSMHKLMSRPGAYFAQIAKLFAERSEMAIDYRASGFRCDTQKFEELDVRPYFPMHADDKENRFQRTMGFFLKNQKIHRALERYIIDSHNASVASGAKTELPRIGGVELLSLRIPIPDPGSEFPRYSRIPLAEIPPTWTRKVWYVTPPKEAAERCAEGVTP